MLASLHIENIALIRRLDLDPAEGFCAFTGETGAGKSILIDSIGLLCGARGGKELIRSGETEAIVEGMFYPTGEYVPDALRALDAAPDEDGALFLQRKLNIDGRSSAKINGKTVPVSFLREVTGLLLHIHGQQDTQSLASEDKQRFLLDAYAGNEDLLNAYGETYKAFRECKKELEASEKLAKELDEKKDLLLYQQTELKSAKLKPGEEAELLNEHTVLANRGKITENASLAFGALYGSDASAVAMASSAKSALRQLAPILPDGEELQSRLENALEELTDIADTLRSYAEAEEDGGNRLSRVEERLERIAALKRKYRTDEAGLIEKLSEVTRSLQSLENHDADQEERRALLKRLEQTLQTQARELRAKRQSAAQALSERVREALSELDMPNVRFVIRIEECEFRQDGADRIDFSVSANAGEEVKPIGKIASGGELSRIMLCLQCVLADVEEIGTLVFDEIDTGISGKTNEKIGRMMQNIASTAHTQVICVTHAAQLAACASHQFRISKSEKDGRTETEVKLLSREERIGELARIMGGLQLTNAVRKAAEELLEGAV